MLFFHSFVGSFKKTQTVVSWMKSISDTIYDTVKTYATAQRYSKCDKQYTHSFVNSKTELTALIQGALNGTFCIKPI